MADKYFDLSYMGEQVDEAIGRTLGGGVEEAVAQAQQYAENAESAMSAAENAENQAVKAKEAIENMTVEANTLSPGSQATATKNIDPSTGSVKLLFGLPQGSAGPAGPSGPAGPAGPPGIQGPIATVDGVFVSNPNLLDNWYLPDPVNQRGKTAYNTTGYVMDRWYANKRNYDLQISLLSSGVQLSSTSGSGNDWYVSQILELNRFLPGTYTLSVLANSVSGNVSMQVQLNKSPYTTFLGVTAIHQGLTTATFTIPAMTPNDNQQIAVYLRGAVGTAVIKAVKLELGDTQTLAHQDANGNWVLNDPPPNKALELAKCQRYFQRTKYAIATYRDSSTTRTIHLYVNTPVTMRAKPVVTIEGDFQLYKGDDAKVFSAVSGTVDSTSNIVAFNATSTEELTTPYTGNVETDVLIPYDEYSYINLSADL